MTETDRLGRVPLHYAAADGDAEAVARHLKEWAVDRTDALGFTALNLAVGAFGDPATVEALLAAGADCEHVDGDGHTPLLDAVLNNHVRAAELLVRAGADPQRRTPWGGGTSPLQAATRFGRQEILDALGA